MDKKRINKIAGEIRFVKDRGGDASQWAYSTLPPSKREISKDYIFKNNNNKPLTDVLNFSMKALDNASSAYDIFAKLKSVDISPDGLLGGKGYIQKIVDMRRQFMNIVEALSAISDTLHDEMTADHWGRKDERAEALQNGEGVSDNGELDKGKVNGDKPKPKEEVKAPEETEVGIMESSLHNIDNSEKIIDDVLKEIS